MLQITIPRMKTMTSERIPSRPRTRHIRPVVHRRVGPGETAGKAAEVVS